MILALPESAVTKPSTGSRILKSASPYKSPRGGTSSYGEGRVFLRDGWAWGTPLGASKTDYIRGREVEGQREEAFISDSLLLKT